MTPPAPARQCSCAPAGRQRGKVELQHALPRATILGGGATAKRTPPLHRALGRQNEASEGARGSSRGPLPKFG